MKARSRGLSLESIDEKNRIEHTMKSQMQARALNDNMTINKTYAVKPS
jgi:hypothetical protein